MNQSTCQMIMHQIRFSIQMIRRIQKPIHLLILFFFLRTGISEAGQTWESLITPPVDSIDAVNVRIWLPIDHSHLCLVTISIVDSSGSKVRLLLSEPLKKDYYNFFWDKRDDSGKFVVEGEYSYIVDDCGKKRSGKIVASYKEWELLSNIVSNEKDMPFMVELELLKDSATVSIEVVGRLGNIVANPISDSLLDAGKHNLRWNHEKGKRIRRGQYTLAITVGDFTYYRKVKVR